MPSLRRLRRAALIVLGVSVVLTGFAAERSFVVAALKVQPLPGDKLANLARFESLARQAAAAGAGLIVTPECYLDGYMGSATFRPGMTREKMLREHTEVIDGPALQKVSALARELQVHILFGFSERRGSGLFNTIALFRPDGTLGGATPNPTRCRMNSATPAGSCRCSTPRSAAWAC